MAWRGIVGKRYLPAEFRAYVARLQFSDWKPDFVVLHNTGAPTLAQRPHGFTPQQMLNLQGYYRDTQKWSAGPHVFCDQIGIWVFTPLTLRGVHSPSWNGVSWGVEMLGDYDAEAFDSGPGLLVQRNAISALATLHARLGLDSSTLRLHFEDPKTTHACPGKHVQKATVIQAMHDEIVLQQRKAAKPARKAT